MKKILLLLASFALALSSLDSCTKQEEPGKVEPETPEEEKKEDDKKEEPEFPVPGHLYIYNGEELSSDREAGSVLFTAYSGYYVCFLSPVPGLVTPDDYQRNEFIAVFIFPTLNGKQVDIKTETTRYALYIGDGKSDPVLADPAAVGTEDFSGGAFTLTIEDDGKSSLMLDVTLRSGTRYLSNQTGNYLTPEEGDPSEDFLSFSGTDKRMAVAFYRDPLQPGYEPEMYFSSGGVDYFEELEKCPWRARMSLPSSICDGRPHEIDSSMEIEMWDGDYGLQARVTSGVISVLKTGEYSYSITVSDGLAAWYDGNHSFAMQFNGTLKNGYEEKPYDIYYSMGSDKHDIGSVLVAKNKADDEIKIYVTENVVSSVEQALGETELVVITATLSQIERNSAVGFSTDPKARIQYKGHSWSRADNTDTGTIRLVGELSDPRVIVEVLNIPKREFSLMYRGRVTEL